MNERSILRGELWKSMTKSMRREIIAAIIAFIFIGVCFGAILLGVITDNSTEEQPLPTPVYTNNHGQSLVVLSHLHSGLKKWMGAHPNAKIISIGICRGNECFIIYEENKP